MKFSLNRAQKNYRKDPLNKTYKEKLFCERKKFKKSCKSSERLFRNKLTEQLLSIEKEKPDQFWDLIKKMKSWGKSNDQCDHSIPP